MELFRPQSLFGICRSGTKSIDIYLSRIGITNFKNYLNILFLLGVGKRILWVMATTDDRTKSGVIAVTAPVNKQSHLLYISTRNKTLDQRFGAN